MQLINHYSMLFSAIFMFALIAWFLLRDGFKAKDGLILGVVLLALFGGWLALKPKAGTITEASQFEVVIGQGTAVLIELQSPF